MPRIRTIKPEMSQDEELSGVSVEAHLLAYGLLPFSDDEGYFNANPKLIKGTVFPIRLLEKSIDQLLEELAGIDFVRLGTAPDGKRYGHIVHFLDHQRVSHPSPSKIKALAIAWGNSTDTPQVLASSPESFRPEGKGIELNGTELNGMEGKAPAAQTAPPPNPIVIVSVEPYPEEGEPPPGLTEIEYAQCFWERMSQAADKGTLNVTAQAIKLYAAREQIPMPAATMQMLARAKLAIEAGRMVNRFWITDAEYDPKRGNGNGRPTKTDERKQRNRAAIVEGLGLSTDAGPVAGSDDAAVQGGHSRGGGRDVGPDPPRLRRPSD